MKKINPLLKHCKKALQTAESWIHDQLDGTSLLKNELSKLEPIRKAIAREEKKCQK